MTNLQVLIFPFVSRDFRKIHFKQAFNVNIESNLKNHDVSILLFTLLLRTLVSWGSKMIILLCSFSDEFRS